MEKCKNCGKLEKTHHNDGSGKDKKEYNWCYPVEKFPPKDKRYFMRFETEKKDWRKELNKINAEILLLERRKDRLLTDNLEKPKECSHNHGSGKLGGKE